MDWQCDSDMFAIVKVPSTFCSDQSAAFETGFLRDSVIGDKLRKVDLAVISDVHLGTDGCQAEALLQYLDRLRPRVLVLNGDILDGWMMNPLSFPESHLAIFRRFLEFANRDVTVFYLTGNHDDMLRPFADLRSGNFHIRDEVMLEVDQQRMLFLHGDRFDPSVQDTRRRIAIWGSWWNQWIIRIDRGINARRLRRGKKPLRLSHWVKQRAKMAAGINSEFERDVADYALIRRAQTVVCGHVHRTHNGPIKARNGQTVHYLNSGDWVENCSALEYVRGHWRVYRYAVDEIDLASSSLSEEVDHSRELVHGQLDKVASLQLMVERERQEEAREARYAQ